MTGVMIDGWVLCFVVGKLYEPRKATCGGEEGIPLYTLLTVNKQGWYATIVNWAARVARSLFTCSEGHLRHSGSKLGFWLLTVCLDSLEHKSDRRFVLPRSTA